jgi:type I restriction enzyme S subunit
MRTGHTPSRSEPEYWEGSDIPWFTLADVWQLREGRQKYLGETKERISRLGLENSAAELLPAGTVVLSRTASVGFSGIMPVPMATSQDFWNWVPGGKLVSEYLLYAFRSMQHEFERLIMGSTHKTIYQPDAARLAIAVPPIAEQAAMVRYIDRETEQIDQMVAKVEAAIERLQEYRAALITAAVTGKIDVRAAGALPCSDGL